MDENRKRTIYNNVSEFRVFEETINGDNEISPWLSIDVQDELSLLLETEITSPVKVKFIENPYSMSEIFHSSSSFITINGNEESCGSSYSDSASSVMASLDLSGYSREACIEWFQFRGVAWVSDAESACSGEMDEGMDCCCEFDDEMLARFIGEEVFEC